MEFYIPGSADSLPSRLDPRITKDTLPSLDHADVRHIGRSGVARLGIVVAILDHHQRLLVLEHKRSNKSPAGSIGPLGETAQMGHNGSIMVVETTAHTLSRGMREEISIDAPQELQLRAKRRGAWLLHRWPVGTGFAGQTALAICPVVQLEKGEDEVIKDLYTETEETRRVAFLPVNDVFANKQVRPGTHAWLQAVARSGLMSATRDNEPDFVCQKPHPDY